MAKTVVLYRKTLPQTTITNNYNNNNKKKQQQEIAVVFE